MAKREITVVGAGIVGACCALYLLRDGHRVTLLEREGPGEGCSKGNAGMLESNAVTPIAEPKLIRELPGMLMDPMGPLAVRWMHLPRLLPWLIRFLWQSRGAAARANAHKLAPLVRHAFDAYGPLLDATGSADLVRESGWLWVFENEKTFRGFNWGQAIRRELGIEMQTLRGDALFDMAPALRRDAALGLFFPTTRACTEPHELVRRLVAGFEREGGRLARAEVSRVEPGPPIRLHTDTGTRDAEAVVLACGAWTGRLCRQLGEPVPLNTERGYHAMLPDPGVSVPVPMMFAEHKFVANQMQGGLRLAGTAELGGLDRPADWRRSEHLIHHASRLLPGLGTDDPSFWMGFRPTLPDSLPVIGPSARHEGIYYAFGHQHLGLTLGALTGQMIAEAIGGRSPIIDTAPYAISRF